MAYKKKTKNSYCFRMGIRQETETVTDQNNIDRICGSIIESCSWSLPHQDGYEREVEVETKVKISYGKNFEHLLFWHEH